MWLVLFARTDHMAIGANDAISWSETFTAKWSDIYRGGNLSWEAVTEEQKPVVDTAEADWVRQISL